MIDIERISEKIRDENDNLIAKAFTCQISNLLLTNGIVPIMTEHSFEDLETITDSDRYKLVYELGISFDSLDTSKHDKQIRKDIEKEKQIIIDNLMKTIFTYKEKLFYLFNRLDELSAYPNAEELRKLHYDNMDWVKDNLLINEYYEYFIQRLKEQKNDNNGTN